MVLPSPVFSAEDVLKTVQDERCTALHGVPTMFIAELNHPDFPLYSMATLRTGIMAGSPCPVEVMKEVNRKMNMSEIVIVYGQTETSPGVTMNHHERPLERRVSTVGRVFPHTELRSWHSATKKVVPPRRDRGDLPPRLPGQEMLLQQSQRDHATIDSNRWNHTGDLAPWTRKGSSRSWGG